MASTEKDDFYIVALGASAGGQNALFEFFSAIPANPGAAFVVVRHLLPWVKSNQERLLAQYTPLKVLRAENGQRVQVNCVYMLPEGKTMTIRNGMLWLKDRPAENKINQAVDVFFTSLAEDVQQRAIGIILSGAGDDGVEGVRAIGANGGIVMVQDPHTALFESMPRAAIEKDDPDLILPTEKLAKILLNHLKVKPYFREKDISKQQAS